MTQENNFDEVRQIFESLYSDNWTESEIAYQDIPYNVKKDISYIALNILFAESENSGLNSENNPNSKVIESGVLLIEIHTPANKGSSTNLILGGKARELAHNKQFSGTNGYLYTYAGNINRVGEFSDFLQYNVSIPFEFN